MSEQQVVNKALNEPDAVEVIDGLLDAWEALPGGRYEGRSGFRKIDNWLRDHMSPAVNKARKYRGRKPPNYGD